MPASDFKDALKQQADIVRIVGDYVKLKKAGAQNFSGLCPFHNEKTPSFSVHATRQFFHCFGCGVSGDVFSFVQKIENITFPEAVRRIAQKLGVPMPRLEFSSPQEAREAKLRMALLDVQERACAFFQECLRRPEGAGARAYLAGRGLDEETIAKFRIGYAPDSGFLLRDALCRDFDQDLLRESGLFSFKEAASSEPRTATHARPQAAGDSPQQEQRPPLPAAHDDAHGGDAGPLAAQGSKPPALYSKFRNRVMFPIANDAGRIIAFTGRTLSTDEKAGPKYLNSPETAIYSKSRVLFNLDRAKEAIRKLDGLHLAVHCRISKRDCQFGHRLHRAPGPLARPIQQERRRELRSRYRRRPRYRAHTRPAGRRGIPDQGAHPGKRLRSRPLHPPQRERRIRRRAPSRPALFRLPDRARPRPVPGALPGGQGAGRELPVAPRPARSQPHCARRTRPRDRPETRHRFRPLAPGTQARCRHALLACRQGPAGNATHRR